MTNEEMIKALADVRDQLVRDSAPQPVEGISVRTSQTSEADRLAGARSALIEMLAALDSWIDGAKENHEAMEHRGESTGEECWNQFHPNDIRRMINDAAREIGISEVWKG